MPAALVEGEHYYVENGRWVFTAAFLLARGHCCGSGCRHCPYPAESSSHQVVKSSGPEDRGDGSDLRT